MKEYKGIYHNVQDKTKSFEYGAHFKYSELYNALINLQLKQQNENVPSEEKKNTSSKNVNQDENTNEKRKKKYKLRTLADNGNNRYLNTDSNQRDNEKSEFSIIEEEQENKNRKRNRFITKSVEKIHLPKIGSNSSSFLQNRILNTESNGPIKLNQSQDFLKKKINFPKLNSLHKSEIISETQNVETQSRFPDNSSVKIYNNSFDKNQMLPITHKKNKDKIFPKLFLLGKDNNEEKVELISKPHRKPEKLKSIFETEKKIKNNNLFLGDKNNYINKDLHDLKNDQMAQQIHNLKKQLLGFTGKKLKGVYQ